MMKVTRISIGKWTCNFDVCTAMMSCVGVTREGLLALRVRD